MNSYQVDRQKWAKLSIFEQMGNIYSEVGRTFKAVQGQDVVASESAAIRALDLFDATAEDLALQKSPKLVEVLRAREVFVQDYKNGTTTLDSYFLPFAIAARLQQ